MSTPADQLPDAVNPEFQQIYSALGGPQAEQNATMLQNRADALPTPEQPTIKGALEERQQIDQQDPFQGLPPVDHLQELMSGAPLLIGLSALGGKAFGVPAQAMLQGTNGMVSGLIKGDQQAYQQAKDKYDQEYSRWEKKHDETYRIYNELRQAYKSQFGEKQAAQRAAEKAAALVGADKQHAYAMLQTGQKLKEQEAKRAKADASREDALLLKATADAPKIVQGYSRADRATQEISKMEQMLPQLLERYKAKTGSTVVPSSVGTVMSALSDDPLATAFTQLSRDLKGDLIGLEMPQGTRGNMFIQKVLADTAPNLWTMSAGELTTAVAGARTIAEQSKSTQKKQIDNLNSIITRHGGSPITPDPANLSLPAVDAAVNAPPTSSERKDGEKGTSKSGKPMHWDAAQKTWVYD